MMELKRARKRVELGTGTRKTVRAIKARVAKLDKSVIHMQVRKFRVKSNGKERFGCSDSGSLTVACSHSDCQAASPSFVLDTIVDACCPPRSQKRVKFAVVGAFITFNAVEARNKCLAFLKTDWISRFFRPKKYRFRGTHVINSYEAEPPTNINYHNLQVCGQGHRQPTWPRPMWAGAASHIVGKSRVAAITPQQRLCPQLPAV